MFMLHFSAFVLVSLLSLSAAAPTDDCSQLLQSMTTNKLHQILGKWILIKGIANNELFDSVLGSVESMWMELNTTADNQTLLLYQANRLKPHPHQPEDLCSRHATNMTLTDGKVLEMYIASPLTYYKFVQTCPDCLLIYSFNKVNDYKALFLFGRNGTPPASELETLRNQAACFQFPQTAGFHYDPNKELCHV